eukprot:495551-Lingulodinium_polyedra.AAC.1
MPYAEGHYETAFGRGVYSSSEWAKARGYAAPRAAPKASKATASIVLLVRSPGSLEKVGVVFKTGTKA